jgi:fluoride exporter
MSRLLLVCLGGAVGTGARYLLALWLPRAPGASFPCATLLVNVAGSFLLGALMHAAPTAGLMSPTLRLVLATGVMGGFTTYSTFNQETLEYLRAGAFAMAGLYVMATLLACLAGGMAGVALGRWLAGR